MKRSRALAIIIIVSVCCILMALTDAVIKPDYIIKSATKLLLFGNGIVLFCVMFHYREFIDVLRIKKKQLLLAIVLGAGVFCVILAAYLIFRNVFDFSGITKALTSGNGIGRDSFIPVAIYISFVNSFLEELFFRGFAFLTLRRFIPTKYAYLFSTVMFAAYHIAIMRGWFSLPVFILTMTGLIAGGVIFCFLDSKSDSVYPAWFTHMFANFAINGIGMILFDII